MESERKDPWRALRWIIYAVLLLAISSAVLLPVGGGARNASKKAQAINDLTQLTVAIKAYYTDSGVYPVDPSVHWSNRAMYDLPGGAHHNLEIINVLRGDTTGTLPRLSDVLNPREIVYLDVPMVKDTAQPKSGLGTGAETNGLGIKTPGEWYDPWGNPYMIVIDTSGKGISDLGFIYSDANLAAPNSIKPPVSVVAISFGPDGKVGRGGNGVYTGSDDVMFPRIVQ